MTFTSQDQDQGEKKLRLGIKNHRTGKAMRDIVGIDAELGW
jgi:hypothetical protein